MATQPPNDRNRSRPRSASPADRGIEHAAHQARLKDEAAARRLQASQQPSAAPRAPRVRHRAG